MAIAIGALTLIGVGSRVNDQLQELRTASVDNVQWTLTQLEVELLVLDRAVNTARIHNTDISKLADVRQRFNVLYSRVVTLQTGAEFSEMRADPEISLGLEEIMRLLDGSVAIIDGNDADLVEALPYFSDAAREMRPQARAIAIKGIRIFSERSARQRSVLSALLTTFSVLTVVMIVALGTALAFLFHQFSVAHRESLERRRTTARLESTVGVSLDAVIVADAAGVVIDYSGAAENIFGYDLREAIGRPLVELIVPDKYREAHLAGMKRFLDTGEKRVIGQGLVQLDALHKDGHEFPVEVSIAQAAGPNGPIFVSFIRDITDRIETQNKLTQALEDALAADNAKSSFLAVMSHEMRTPINGVMGTLDLLSATDLTDTQRQYVDLAKVSGNVLLRHVNDVLDISKAEAGKLEIHSDVFQPEALIKEVLSSNEALAEIRSNTLHCQIDIAPESWVIGDSFRLRQVLLNLVGNAIKFTENGQIDVRVSQSATDTRLHEFRITDTGIGIPDDQLDRIFEDFVTLDTGYARRSEGTGLGLGISQRMATALGGEIGVTSKAGVGSSFWVKVPLSAAELPVVSKTSTPAARPQLPNGHRPLSILTVEDNPINSFVLKEALESFGHSVSQAQNGKLGVEQARKISFDVIFMDVSMPVMDGVKATELIRQSDTASQGAPIIGLTAHALAEEQEQFLAAGMTRVLTKPASLADLEQVLSDIGSSERLLRKGNDKLLLDHEVIDQLQNLLGASVFQKNLERFFTEANETLETCGELKTGKQVEALIAKVHALAGSSEIFGATELQTKLTLFEQGLNAGVLEAAQADFAALQDVWKNTHREYQQLTSLARD